MIYFLLITDTELSYDNFTEDFMIGAFDTEEKAIKIAEYYIANVEGFNKYECTYRVEKKSLDNPLMKIPKEIWIVQGWNENSNLDAVDIVESICISSKEIADIELQNMQKQYIRSEWCVDNYKINELHWKEGFVRV